MKRNKPALPFVPLELEKENCAKKKKTVHWKSWIKTAIICAIILLIILFASFYPDNQKIVSPADIVFVLKPGEILVGTKLTATEPPVIIVRSAGKEVIFNHADINNKCYWNKRCWTLVHPANQKTDAQILIYFRLNQKIEDFSFEKVLQCPKRFPVPFV